MSEGSDQEKENDQPQPPTPKRKHLSLKLKRKDRFVSVSSQHVDELKKPIIPKNTERSTQWAVGCFDMWLQHYNEGRSPNDQCPKDILLSDDLEKLCHWLCVCVCEIRKTDGSHSEYTPRSIAQLIGGLQRYNISLHKERQIRLSDPKNPVFQALHRTLDNPFKQQRL